MAGGWLTTEQAAQRLGVKPQTLYAYVSRGLLTSEPAPGRRGSRFRAADIERLAARTRSGGRAGALEVVVDTELTLLDPDGALYYRGWDVAEAARTASFERVAEWLWSGTAADAPPWSSPPELLAVATSAQAALPGSATVVDRVRVAAAAAGTVDPLRHDRRPPAVAATARALIATLVESLPERSTPAASVRIGGRTRRNPLAARLWSRLSDRPPKPAELVALNGALVLLADHELAASTFAVRVAASAWADPYLVVLTGLGVVGGALHGAQAPQVHRLLERARVEGAAHAVGDVLRDNQVVPGFGHRVYRGPDPRAVVLDRLVRAAAGSRSTPLAVADEVVSVLAERGVPAPNIDFALALLSTVMGLDADAGEAVFALARCAGWIAHAIEEYRFRLRFRPRAAYTGLRPEQA